MRGASNPRAFYDSYGREEWRRLETGIDGKLEFEETISALTEHLPESGRVLDAGGGSGRYAVWLAERGYDVTLLDLSRRQTELAREYAAEYGVAADVSVVRGSITNLGFEAGTFDATCCLGGPISHLLDERKRFRAVRELRRVSVSEAPVFVSVMGLLGVVQLYLMTGFQLEALPDLLEHGDYDASLLDEYGYEQPFTDTHFFRREELVALLSEAGLAVSNVVGLEGLGSVFHDERIRENVSDLSPAESEALERTVSATNADPVVADLSVHVLAIANA